MHEAVDGGVPILGFPLFFDQPRNMGLLVDLGIALTLDILTVDKATFIKTINILINNPSYDMIYYLFTKLDIIINYKKKAREYTPAAGI